MAVSKRRGLPWLILWWTASLVMAPTAFGDNYPRNTAVDVLHYQFEIGLRDENDVIEGTTFVDIRFREAGVEFVELDLVGSAGLEAPSGMQVHSVHSDQDSLEFAHQNNRLKIGPFEPSAEGGQLRLQIKYSGIPQTGLIIRDNRYGDRTFFADNFPNRARHWIPVLDHPYDKSTCEFLITAPGKYQAVANGLLLEESDLEDGRRLTHWRQTIPISTYQMVIGVASFSVRHLEPVDGIPIQAWVFPQDKLVGFASFGEADKPLRFFQSKIGPFPYEKLANVQTTNRYGATEFASSVFYGEQVFVRGRAFRIMVHEIAHQWFGDSITTDDWNHVWLSEGFATYLTHMYFESTEGRSELATGMDRDRQRVFGNANRSPDQPLVDYRLPVERTLTSDAYVKGGWVLHMLRRQVGDEAFWQGLREYYRQYRDDNALSEDFQKVMERSSGQDLNAFFQQWLYRPGHPRLEGDWHFDPEAKQVVVRLRQVQAQPAFRFDMDVGFEQPDQIHTVRMSQPEQEFRLPLNRAPASVSLDPNVWLLADIDFSPR